MTCCCYAPTGQVCMFHQREAAIGRIHAGYPQRGDVHLVTFVTGHEQRHAREQRLSQPAPNPPVQAE